MTGNINFKDAFKKANERTNVKNSPRNIPVLVQSYNVESSKLEEHFIYGLDLIKNTQIKISLRPLDEPLTSGHSRLEIRDLADTSNKKVHVAAEGESQSYTGGIIVFENCYTTGKDTYSASWANTAVHKGGINQERIESSYTTIVVHPSKFDPRQPQKPLHNVAFVRQAQVNYSRAFAAANSDEMLAFLKICMNQQIGQGGYRPEAILRYVDKRNPAEIDVYSVLLTSPTYFSEEESKHLLYSPSECVDIFLGKPLNQRSAEITSDNYLALQAIVSEMKANSSLDFSSFFVEIIPVVRRNLGSEKRKELFGLVRKENGQSGYLINQRSKVGDRYFNRFHKRASNETLKLWIPATISTLCAFDISEENGAEVKRPVDYHFVKEVFTNDVFPSGFEQHYLPTQFFSNDQFIIERYGVTSTSSEEVTIPLDVSTHAEEPHPVSMTNTSQNFESAVNHVVTRPCTGPGMFDELEKLILES
ncbi:hypothetical protein [Vibrio anguillarum]|uniref:hypothetical protein n=3 Tax=Vibrio anguillarum TaxID=55601 RepID=UPI000BB5183E|nr:hypothetical protein [Vibrio anguillarum]ATC60277.1 hypothetical protein CMV05_23085 [Vibrio anguillarum]